MPDTHSSVSVTVLPLAPGGGSLAPISAWPPF